MGLCDNLEGGMGWEVGGRLKRERMCVYLWLTHVDVWQKPSQYSNYPPVQNVFKRSILEKQC